MIGRSVSYIIAREAEDLRTSNPLVKCEPVDGQDVAGINLQLYEADRLPYPYAIGILIAYTPEDLDPMEERLVQRCGIEDGLVLLDPILLLRNGKLEQGDVDFLADEASEYLRNFKRVAEEEASKDQS